MYTKDVGILFWEPIFTQKVHQNSQNDKCYHFTKNYSSTGTDAAKLGSKRAERFLEGSEAVENASLAEKRRISWSDDSTHTKGKLPWRTTVPTIELRPPTERLRLDKIIRMLHKPVDFHECEDVGLYDTGCIQTLCPEMSSNAFLSHTFLLGLTTYLPQKRRFRLQKATSYQFRDFSMRG